MPEERKYSRVYHDAIDDPRFTAVWPSDANLALWLRLLVVADGTWPAPAPVPRSTKTRALAALVECGLVELVAADHFRIHGMNSERGPRSRQASHAADVRWHSDSSANGNAPGIANPMPSKVETSKVKTSIRQGFKDPLLAEIRAAVVERYGDGGDTPIVVQPVGVHPFTCGTCPWEGPTRQDYLAHCVSVRHDNFAAAAAEQEREALRLEALALHERYLAGELGPAEYERLRVDLGKQPDDLTRAGARGDGAEMEPFAAQLAWRARGARDEP